MILQYEALRAANAMSYSYSRVRHLFRAACVNTYARLAVRLLQDYRFSHFENEITKALLAMYKVEFGQTEKEWLKRSETQQVSSDIISFLQTILQHGGQAKFEVWRFVCLAGNMTLLDLALQNCNIMTERLFVELAERYRFGHHDEEREDLLKIIGSDCEQCGVKYSVFPVDKTSDRVLCTGSCRRLCRNRSRVSDALRARLREMAARCVQWAKRRGDRIDDFCATYQLMTRIPIDYNTYKMVTDIHSLVSSKLRKLYLEPTNHFTNGHAYIYFRLHHPSVWATLAKTIFIGPFQTLSCIALEGLAYHSGAFVAQSIVTCQIDNIPRDEISFRYNARKERRGLAAQGCAFRRLVTHGRGVRLPHHVLREVLDYVFFDTCMYARFL